MLRFLVLRVLLPIVCLLVCGVLSGCKPDSPGQESQPVLTVVDGLDRTVELTRMPERVVSIAPGATHIVRAAGGLSSLIGVTTADYDAEDLANLPRISALPLDFESIVALDPDLILASDQVNDPAHAELFDALDIPIVYLGSDSWDDVHTSILLTGRMLATQETAELSADSLQGRVDALQSITAELTETPSAIFLISSSRSYSFGRGSYVLDLMRWAGMDPLTDEFDTPAPILDDEWVLLNNPDIIVGSFGQDAPVIDELLKNHPTWHTLDAIRNGRVINVPTSTVLTPGPENVRASWFMAQRAHPDLFEEMEDPAP